MAETDNAGHILGEYMWIGDEPVAVIDWTITSGTPVLHFAHTDHQGGGNMQRRMIIAGNW